MLSGAAEIADRFCLGAPVSVSPVAGGLSNDLWKVVTDTGTYAVKVMRAHVDEPDFRSNVEAAYAVEARAFEEGVPCPEPVTVDGRRCLDEVAGQLVRVHRWVDGHAVVASECLEEVASLTARIHAIHDPFDATLDDQPWSAEAWASLADHAEMPVGLAQRLREAAAALATLEGATAATGLTTAHVDSHGDLDPKNTLAVDGALAALDWDAAGPQAMLREAASVALDWSSDPDEFHRVVAAYGRASDVLLPAEPWVLGGWVSALGGWLVHNATARPDTRRGQQEIARTCDRLLFLHAHLGTYLDALRAV